MAKPSGSDVKLSSLLNLDGLESVISSVTSDVSTLRQSVVELEQRLDDAVPSPEFVDFSTRAATLLDEIKHSISRIEHSINVSSPDVTFDDQSTIGSIVAAHQKRVEDLTDSLGKKASVEDVNGACEAIMAELSSFQSKVSVESATTMDITGLSKIQENQAQHVAALEGLLNTKMDKMEASRVEAAADKIENFASTYAAMKSEMLDLHEQLGHALERQQDTGQRLEELRMENEELRAALESSAGRNALEAVATTLANVEKGMAMKSSKVEVQKLEKTQDLISATLGELSRSLVDAKKVNKRAHEAVLARLGGMVEKLQLEKQLEQSKKLKEMAQVSRDLEKELALYKTVQADLVEEVEQMKEEKRKLESKVELSVRFIEWFSDREDAFEIKQRFGATDSPTSAQRRRPFYPVSPNTTSSSERASSAAKRLASIRSGTKAGRPG